MNPNIYYNLSAENYHKADGISKSGLDQFRKSPAHYKHWLTAEREETPAMRIGTLTHMSVFQPEMYADRVVVAPIVDRRTKEGKSIWEQFKADNEGKDIITQPVSFKNCGSKESNGLGSRKCSSTSAHITTSNFSPARLACQSGSSKLACNVRSQNGAHMAKVSGSISTPVTLQPLLCKMRVTVPGPVPSSSTRMPGSTMRAKRAAALPPLGSISWA